ncbi:hypothetical protein BGZ47_002163 [Haplosporangium gracile]|nr:hypothetical protein BGZ47_002163 [Haplosporangium gracile]
MSGEMLLLRDTVIPGHQLEGAGLIAWIPIESTLSYWKDWIAILSVVILFISYLYAFKSTKPTKLHKYLRAFLMLLPTVLNMFVNFDYLVRYLRETSRDYSPNARPEERFQCQGSSVCMLTWSMVFMSIILDFFVLCEIVMTLAWGPLGKVHQFGGANGGYTQDANVIIVSPDQPQSQQAYYTHQPTQQQQQAYYAAMQQQAPILQQQAPILQQQQQQLCHQSLALDPNPQYQPPPPAQHLYYYPAVSGVPTTTATASYSPTYPQSPVAASGGYQPAPQQIVSSNSQYYPTHSAP